MQKNWCFWIVVLQKTFESPLDCREIQPVHSEGDQPWDFFGRNDAKAEAPVLWPPHAKSWLIGKDSDAGRNWGQEEKGTIEDEMAGWHHWLDGRESEWTPGVGDGQGGLACCDSWGRKESDTTERLNWTELCVDICGILYNINWVGWGFNISKIILPQRKTKDEEMLNNRCSMTSITKRTILEKVHKTITMVISKFKKMWNFNFLYFLDLF